METVLLTVLGTVGFLLCFVGIFLAWNVYKMLAQTSMLYQQMAQEVLPATVDTLNGAIEVIEHKKSKIGLPSKTDETY